MARAAAPDGRGHYDPPSRNSTGKNGRNAKRRQRGAKAIIWHANRIDQDEVSAKSASQNSHQVGHQSKNTSYFALFAGCHDDPCDGSGRRRTNKATQTTINLFAVAIYTRVKVQWRKWVARTRRRDGIDVQRDSTVPREKIDSIPCDFCWSARSVEGIRGPPLRRLAPMGVVELGLRDGNANCHG